MLSKAALAALGQICGEPAERALETQFDRAHGERRQLIHGILARRRSSENGCNRGT